VSFGDLRRKTPLSRQFGFDRGTPIDRHYIEDFLAGNADDIQGHVLEIGDDTYTKKYGRKYVTKRDILNLSERSPGTTIVGDLTHADHIPSENFDCIILTQTLHLIYDFRSALQTIHRTLKSGGVVLATFPGISQISYDQWGAYWCWSFTALSARRMFEEVFLKENIFVQTFGNVLTATAFLHGLAVEELQQNELDYNDTDYEVLITVKALK
jgi:SAM-dependent methyltransferase